MPESPDAFIEFHDLAQSLEMRGVSSGRVIDALFRLWMRASVHYAGRAGVAISLREIAEEVAGEDIDAPPTAH